MKHLLLILSFLLLYSPLFGQETGVLYFWDTSSGQVWKTFRDKDTQSKYIGQVENGKPNGQGTYTFNDGRKYVGEWLDGEQNGHGTVTSPDGKYVGEWKGNDFHGQGTMISADGTKWVGEFRENKRWNIREYDNNGDITGKYVNGK